MGVCFINYCMIMCVHQCRSELPIVISWLPQQDSVPKLTNTCIKNIITVDLIIHIRQMAPAESGCSVQQVYDIFLISSTSFSVLPRSFECNIAVILCQIMKAILILNYSINM